VKGNEIPKNKIQILKRFKFDTMETLQIDILNPKASSLLKGLAELNLISIHKKLSGKSSKKEKYVTNDTYPFKPQYLKANNNNYILREKLDSAVSFEEGNYIITNGLLDITVWGKTRDEAEDAFAFAFHALYENFANEKDKNLSPDANALKRTLQKIVGRTTLNS
jgi:hypothetical protein